MAGAGAGNAPVVEGRPQSWDAFFEMHGKLSRALGRSIATEKELLEALQRLKNAVVEKSTQLRAALQQKAIDDQTIAELRDTTHAALLESCLAKEKEVATQKLLRVLRQDVRQLKSRLEEREERDERRHAQTTQHLDAASKDRARLHSSSSLVSLASAGRGGGASQDLVGSSSAGGLRVPQPTRAPAKGSAQRGQRERPHEEGSARRSGGWATDDSARLGSASNATSGRLTPFQRWKEQNAHVTPDSPGASLGFLPPGRAPGEHLEPQPLGETGRLKFPTSRF